MNLALWGSVSCALYYCASIFECHESLASVVTIIAHVSHLQHAMLFIQGVFAPLAMATLTHVCVLFRAPDQPTAEDVLPHRCQIVIEVPPPEGLADPSAIPIESLYDDGVL